MLHIHILLLHIFLCLLTWLRLREMIRARVSLLRPRCCCWGTRLCWIPLTDSARWAPEVDRNPFSDRVVIN